MILTIDIGNTNVSLAAVCAEAPEKYIVRHRGKLKTDREKTAAEYGPLFSQWLLDTGLGAGDLEGAVISSVVPTVMDAMEQCVRTQLGMEPMIVSVDCNLGITVDVREPGKIGRDRLVDSAWAAANFPLPVVTADLGTATTFNVITEDRILRGGIIAAGIETGLKALASRTAQLPNLELYRPDHIVGRDTTECMISGAVFGTAGILDGVVSEVEKELGREVSFVITGGGARYVDDLVRHPHVYDPDFLVKGLAYLYRRNH